ncbi:hypothetical protein B0H14DRAFT_2574311 [Mycena olivaceomarginata]|nr:hypothetical protein B0H14DRAFT_2574311 [Mycena olivaceomarginata]
MTLRTRYLRRDPYQATFRDVILYLAAPGPPPAYNYDDGTSSRYRSCGAVWTGKPIRHTAKNLTLRVMAWVQTQPRESRTIHLLLQSQPNVLPVNTTLTGLVGVDPQQPTKRPLWRGDAVLWYNSEKWRDMIDDEEQFKSLAVQTTVARSILEEVGGLRGIYCSRSLMLAHGI